jgi:hypothetical protein
MPAPSMRGVKRSEVAPKTVAAPVSVTQTTLPAAMQRSMSARAGESGTFVIALRTVPGAGADSVGTKGQGACMCDPWASAYGERTYPPTQPPQPQARRAFPLPNWHTSASNLAHAVSLLQPVKFHLQAHGLPYLTYLTSYQRFRVA